VVVAFRQKMETEAAQQAYRQRGAVAEFPNAWIKEKIRLRQFRLRGLAKVRMELFWACLTYNVQQWIRLCWRPPLGDSWRWPRADCLEEGSGRPTLPEPNKKRSLP
jgi:hypothetical protein